MNTQIIFETSVYSAYGFMKLFWCFNLSNQFNYIHMMILKKFFFCIFAHTKWKFNFQWWWKLKTSKVLPTQWLYVRKCVCVTSNNMDTNTYLIEFCSLFGAPSFPPNRKKEQIVVKTSHNEIEVFFLFPNEKWLLLFQLSYHVYIKHIKLYNGSFISFTVRWKKKMIQHDREQIQTIQNVETLV